MKGLIKRCLTLIMAAVLAWTVMPSGGMGTAEAQENEDKAAVLSETESSEGQSSIIKSAAAAGKSAGTVSLVMGEMIYYGSYCTHYYTVEGKIAYCLEPKKQWLVSGEYEAQRLENGNLRKGLYYVYGGPGYETYVAKYGYLGFTGKLVRDDEYGMSHCIAAYLYSGDEQSFTGLTAEQTAALKQKAEKIKGMPEPPLYFNAFLFNTDGPGQVMGGFGADLTGSVEIYKESAQPVWTEENACYSLAGAEFGLFEPGSQTASYRITTNEKGYGKADNVKIGVYEIRELKSSRGYALNPEKGKVTVREGALCRYSCEEPPRYYPAGLILQKKDADTSEAKAQGSASLADAEFTVRYYTGYYDEDPAQKGIEAERSWILKSDEKGQVFLSDEAKVSGGEFYENDSGEYVFPLGTVTFQETKPPRGYLINNEIIVRKITETGPGETDTAFQAAEIADNVIRGHIQIVKFREDIDDEEEQKTPLAGIRFTITSCTTGESETIVTDENGYASTRTDVTGDSSENGDAQKEQEKRGGLVYDNYIVHEENAPQGLRPADDFKVTIDEDGETLYYILENKQIFSPVRLVKTDGTTGKTIPVSGAQFELLDKNKNPLTMTAHYPSQTEQSVFSTDESGCFILPEKLPAGTYYFREILPPQGYMLSGELLRFEIREGHDWDEPFEVMFENEPVKEKIHLEKTDAESGWGIAGVHFDITAKEDIVTPDGTVRLKAGEKAGTLVTDENGYACSQELFPGLYELVETKAAFGYMLPDAPYEVRVEDRGGEGVKAEIKNERTKITDTAALWKESGGKCICPGEETVIVDTVELTNLNKGKEYTLKGTAKDAQTGETLMIGEESVRAEMKFIPQQTEEKLEMEFAVDSEAAAGRKIVICEYLYLEDELVSSHDELEDEGQTVEVLPGQEAAAKTGDYMPGTKYTALLAASLAAGAAAAAAKLAGGRKRKRRL